MSDPIPNQPESAGTPPPPTAAEGVTATPPASAPPAPAAAKPPAPAAAKLATDPSRRNALIAFFTSSMAIAWTSFATSMAAMTLGTIRFLVPNVLSEPPSKFKVGFPQNYEEGQVVERYKDQNAWIVRNDGTIYALSTTCTHLGCTPNWLEREQKFKCPCHGSGFYITGINFEGPAPRPLERWAIFIGDDGQLVVDKSKKFQQERGEWSNPESFIKV
ncbi:MAG TPA: Rieske (2Fe-2S) protein [Gemmataceae bacterium]|nr:Rieske (2Fe-2S) protein [Gemmataceae bacterium]